MMVLMDLYPILVKKNMVTKILKGIQENENMYDDCIRMAEKFDWNRIIPEIVELYNNSI